MSIETGLSTCLLAHDLSVFQDMAGGDRGMKGELETLNLANSLEDLFASLVNTNKATNCECETGNGKWRTCEIRCLPNDCICIYVLSSTKSVAMGSSSVSTTSESKSNPI